MREYDWCGIGGTGNANAKKTLPGCLANPIVTKLGPCQHQIGEAIERFTWMRLALKKSSRMRMARNWMHRECRFSFPVQEYRMTSKRKSFPDAKKTLPDMPQCGSGFLWQGKAYFRVARVRNFPELSNM
jgi:hypothetical protein